MRVSSAAALAAFLGFTTPSPAEVVVVQKDTYFTVRGSSLQAFDRDVKRVGPLDSSTGERDAAATTITFLPYAAYIPGPRSCRVTGPTVRLMFDYIRPRWKPSGRPNAATRTAFNAFENDIRRFQAVQTRIAKSEARKLESALRKLKSERDCATMKAAFDRTTDRVRKIHNERQRALIKRWSKGLKR